ncbi:MAG: hypothetical protein H2040_04265 [Euryhalocaulis sp.]|uniref:hypothetical protein n=1 Tax=Euryhalocaulis sp. TaxID=2744307 RepID=UPI0017B89767|nr:hypothetical protein [Euryhalocaulis sp.]MBA4801053.1 hypothetical protein [Euryhalocaulis sp.]
MNDHENHQDAQGHPLTEEQFEAFWEAMKPPSTPAASLADHEQIRVTLAKFDPIKLSLTIAGLMTEPDYQGNEIRLDWAIRWALALSAGKKTPKKRDLNRILNQFAEDTGVTRLEDPPESVFVENLPTNRGNFRLLPGVWETAGRKTELVMSAFEQLADAPQKKDALDSIYALLTLSEALIQRANLTANINGSSQYGALKLPSETKLKSLRRRLIFTFEELEALGIEAEKLRPFLLPPDASGSLLAKRPGNTLLECFPLTARKNGIAILSPTNISTAIRSHLIETAIEGGVSDNLHYLMLEEARQALNASGFINIPPSPVKEIGGLLIRECLLEYSKGRWVHIIQSMDGFDQWPNASFGSTIEYSKEVMEYFASSEKKASEFAQQRSGFVHGLRLWLPGGWGRGASIEANRPASDLWPLIPIPIFDAAVIGCSGDCGWNDVARLIEQHSTVTNQGFQLHFANGVLNLFQWWQATEYKLVPPDQKDLRPPFMINFDTNLLLETRRAALDAQSRHALPTPWGSYKIVQRFRRQTETDDHKLAFVTTDTIEDGQLLGAVSHGDDVWWFTITDEAAGGDRELAFRTWEALMMWGTRLLPKFQETLSKGNSPILFSISVEGEFVTDDTALQDTISVDINREERQVDLAIKSSWHQFLRAPDNSAEIEIAARVLESADSLSEKPVSEATDFHAVALQAAGSNFYRWRHVFETQTSLEYLAAHGLIEHFSKIPDSAGAKIQSGSVWSIRSREAGSMLTDRGEILEFLDDYKEALLQGLIEFIRYYDKQSLIVSALKSLQSAEGEIRHWTATASAMRAIHGDEIDHEMSMRQLSHTYGVIRASSIIAEIANTEGGKVEKRAVGQMDLEELQALSLMVFEIGDLWFAYKLGQVESDLQISPTGELLFDHQFEEKTLRSTGERLHRLKRQKAEDDYDRRFAQKTNSDELRDDFIKAITAEFGIDVGFMLDFAQYSAELAAQTRKGVFVITRSDFIDQIQSLSDLSRNDIESYVDRLTMPQRESWNELPREWKESDIELARLGRRYSPISRPIIQISDDDVTRLVICPAVIERSAHFIIRSAYSGDVQDDLWQSDAMKRFASKRGDETGKEFDKQIASKLEELGLEAHSSKTIPWCLNEQSTAELKKLGDVDVLAIDRANNTVWVIEAKDLKLCRTLAETSRRLSDYLGKEKKPGKADNMLKHLNRVTYLQARSEALQKRFKLPEAPSVKGLMIVSAPQPLDSSLLKVGDDGTVISFDEIADYFNPESR